MRGTWPQRWWPWLVLGVSLCLNLFLTGLLAGHWQGRDGPPRDHEISQLTDEERADLRARFRESREALEPQVEAVEEARDAAADALRASPMDQAVLAERLGVLRQRTDGLVGAMHARLVDEAPQLPLSVRTVLADRVLTHHRGPKRGPGREGEDGPAGQR